MRSFVITTHNLLLAYCHSQTTDYGPLMHESLFHPRKGMKTTLSERKTPGWQTLYSAGQGVRPSRAQCSLSWTGVVASALPVSGPVCVVNSRILQKCLF